MPSHPPAGQDLTNNLRVIFLKYFQYLVNITQSQPAKYANTSITGLTGAKLNSNMSWQEQPFGWNVRRNSVLLLVLLCFNNTLSINVG